MDHYKKVPPHEYPLWIRIGGAGSMLMLCVCLIRLPDYFALNTKVKEADGAFAHGDYRDAEMRYVEISKLVPHNREIKIRTAKALLKRGESNSCVAAITLLDEMHLGDREIKEVLACVPAEYLGYLELKDVKS
jgi:hypothetical protein